MSEADITQPLTGPSTGHPEAAELIRAHYQLQKGAFISKWQETGAWIQVASEISAVPMWNHAAWLGRGPADPGEFLDRTRAAWPYPSRRPVVYLVDESGLDSARQAAATANGFEKCDQETWMCYAQAAPPSVPSPDPLTVRVAASEQDRSDFLNVFRAAYQARGQTFSNLFTVDKTMDSSPGVHHYVGYAQGKAVCVASILSAGDLACIYNVGTDPQARKHGYAAQLLAGLIRDALTRSVRCLFLQVQTGSSAERLYSRLGFNSAFTRSGYRLVQWSAPVAQPAGRGVVPQFLSAIQRESSKAPQEHASILVPCPPSEYEAAQALATATGVGAESVWIAGWAVLLSRYSQETRVGFGVQVAETSPVRPFWIDVIDQATISEWLRQVDTLLQSATPASANPLQPEPDPTTFECVVQLNGGPEKPHSRHQTRCALEWDFQALNLGQLGVRFDAGKYEADAIRRLAGHLFLVIAGMAADPAQAVGRLDLLSAAERKDLLSQWNRPALGQAGYQPVHQLFEAQVAGAPDAPAVMVAGRSGLEHGSLELTYDQLNRRANRLAACLRGAAVGPEHVVALYLERSAEMVAGLLAIFKAGAICLPLDPDYPKERLEFMLKDARVAAVLTQRSLRSDLPPNAAKVVLADAEASAGYIEENAATTSAPEDGAYVIYTSGSTGQPKGVLIPHRAIAGHCAECKTAYGLTPADRVLQFNSLGFDAAFEQILATLISGATLVLRGQEIWTTKEFGQWMEKCALSVVDLPTAYWHQLLQEWTHSPSVAPHHWPRLMIVGGEAMSPESLRLWRKLPIRSARLINAYGPTEATITATRFEVTPEFLEQELPSRIPIGQPQGPRRACLLDCQGRPVPPGLPGELFLGGPWLACGYINRPESTQARFVSNPFSTDPTERLYKTGDLARYLPDGNLEFLGRTDHQVKIRGYRVELGEVEAALQQHPDLRECAVILQERGSHPHLTAYVVPRNGRCPSGRELRAFLGRTLPEHMVPSRFAALESLPWLPSGKVDRRALPSAAQLEIEEISKTGPRDPLELRLQLLFERILQRRDIGVDASFFELGGDSLQALELIVELERISGKTLPLETLYQTPTVESLAKLLEQVDSAKTWTSLAPLQAGGSRPPLFLVHTTPGDILGYGNLIYHLDPDQPCYGFQSLGLLRPELSHHRIEDMASYYLGLLQSLQPEGPYYLAGWCYGGIVAVEMAQQLRARGERVAFLGLLETVALAPSLRIYRYYLHRLSCFLRMRPNQWMQYFRKKAQYRREVKLANKMRFRRLNTVEGADAAFLEEQNQRLAKLEQVYSSNLDALKVYRPVPYPGKVTLLNAEQMDDGVIADPLYAWPGLAAEIEVHCVPGDHDTMLTEPNVRVLAQKLDECLRRAQEQQGRPEPRTRAGVVAPVRQPAGV